MKIIQILLLCCLLLISIAGCNSSETEPDVCFPAGYRYLSYLSESTVPAGEFRLDSITWGPFSVFISGSTGLADEIRLNAYLLKDDEYVDWWPRQNATVKDGSFMFRAKTELTDGVAELPPFEQGYFLRIISIQNKKDTTLLSLDNPSPVDTTPETTSLPEQPGLDDSSWELVSINDSRLVLFTKITISFDDGKVTGKADCNHYSGNYSALSNGLFNFPKWMSTVLDCGKRSDRQSQAYLDFLTDAACYRVTGDKLELFDAMTGKRTLVFKRVN